MGGEGGDLLGVGGLPLDHFVGDLPLGLWIVLQAGRILHALHPVRCTALDALVPARNPRA